MADLEDVLTACRRQAHPSPERPPHVWLAPVGTSPDDRANWADAGTLPEFIAAFPALEQATKAWTPSRSRSWMSIVEIEPGVRAQAAYLKPPVTRGA